MDRHLRSFDEMISKASYRTMRRVAVLFTTAGPLGSVDGIKAFFQALFAEFGNLKATLSTVRRGRLWLHPVDGGDR